MSTDISSRVKKAQPPLGQWKDLGRCLYPGRASNPETRQLPERSKDPEVWLRQERWTYSEALTHPAHSMKPEVEPILAHLPKCPVRKATSEAHNIHLSRIDPERSLPLPEHFDSRFQSLALPHTTRANILLSLDRLASEKAALRP